jgi:hypothetical protein
VLAAAAVNRVPLEKIQAGLEPVCGRCKTPLPLSIWKSTVSWFHHD